MANRKQISSLTAQEAADELVLMEVSKLLQTARKAQKKADEAVSILDLPNITMESTSVPTEKGEI